MENWKNIHLWWYNLENGSFRPYRKDSKPPTYIHKDSNHPLHMKKELPKMIIKRISHLSSSKEVFEAEAPVYNAALKNSGYPEGLQYNDVRAQHSRRTRKRKITWFNPPWNDAVATNVASKFLQLLDKYETYHPWCKPPPYISPLTVNTPVALCT